SRASLRGSERTEKVWVDARPLTVSRAVNVPVRRAPPPRRPPPPVAAAPGAGGAGGSTGRQTTRCIPAVVEKTSGTACHSGDTRGNPVRDGVPAAGSAGHLRKTLAPPASRISNVTGAAALR